MTAPRQPRQWVEGDPEPTDVYEVQHTNSQRYRRTFVTVNYGGSVVVRFWAWQSGPSGALLSWDTLAGRLGGYKLTEVLTDDEVPGVLPETPEPVSMPVLPTYETYFHGEKLVQCGGCGKQVLQVLHSCKGIPAPQSSPAPLLPLSAPVETEGRVEGVSEALSPQSEIELKLWNLLDKAEQEYLASDEPCDRKSALVRAVLAEGWRPPLPPLSKVAPFDPDDETPAALAAFFLTPWFDGHARLAAGAARGLDVLGVIAKPEQPLAAHEVEWSVRAPDASRFYYRPTTDEEDAREEAACREGNTLGKRDVWYGPWIAVPVEPKETK